VAIRLQSSHCALYSICWQERHCAQQPHPANNLLVAIGSS
jgi:hypothetical protein